jgi:hypothetical protein
MDNRALDKVCGKKMNFILNSQGLIFIWNILHSLDLRLMWNILNKSLVSDARLKS